MKTFLDEARNGRFKNAAQLHDQSPIFGLPRFFHFFMYDLREKKNFSNIESPKSP